MGNKLDDFLNAIKIGELIHRKDPMERKRHNIFCILAVIGGVAIIAAIAYAVYRYMNPDYLEDFDDDFDDYEEDMDLNETMEPNQEIVSEE